MRTGDGPPADGDGRPGVDSPHFDCAEWMRQEFTVLTGIEVWVTEVPPAQYAVICPHGITLYFEPKDQEK